MFCVFDTSWRAYVRDPRAPSPRTLDTALLLCEGHGLLLAPPHVEEFLSGDRRALLGGLDPDRSGCVCEVLTPEEWDALTVVRAVLFLFFTLPWEFSGFFLEPRYSSVSGQPLW